MGFIANYVKKLIREVGKEPAPDMYEAQLGQANPYRVNQLGGVVCEVVVIANGVLITTAGSPGEIPTVTYVEDMSKVGDEITAAYARKRLQESQMVRKLDAGKVQWATGGQERLRV